MGGSGSVALRKWFLSCVRDAFTRPGGFALVVFTPHRRRFHATQQLYDGGFFLMWAALFRALLFHALCGKCAELRQPQRRERTPLCKKEKHRNAWRH